MFAILDKLDGVCSGASVCLAYEEGWQDVEWLWEGGKRPESRCVSSQPWRHAKGKTLLDTNSGDNTCTVSSSLSCAARRAYCPKDELRSSVMRTDLALDSLVNCEQLQTL